jgi:hypothetical protein
LKPALPLTPGLLISMSIRNDHSFGMNDIHAYEMLDLARFGMEKPDPLVDKQKKLIGISFMEYTDYIEGAEVQSQRKEEIVGEGFYNAEREEFYKSYAQPEALRYAQELCDDANASRNRNAEAGN